VAATLRRTTDPVEQPLLKEQLRSDPWSFDFFQAIRLLTLLQPHRQAIGEFAPPHSEAVRIGAQPSLAFPASQLQALDWREGFQPSMRVNFLGLTGPLGVLPAPYTELLVERQRSRDSTLADFLDLFHHRITSLFYKAWEKSHFPVGFERSLNDPLTEALFALIGFGTPGLRHRQAVLDETLLFYSGLFRLATRPAIALETILADYFRVPVSIEQFIGVWRRLEETDCTFLDSGPQENYQLGVGAVLGDEVWDQKSRARICIGPVPLERYLDFLPDGSAYAPLRSLTRAYCGDEIEFEIQLILERHDVPACELGEEGREGPRLGWLTWLKSKPEIDRDPGDTVVLV